ncbi:MAG TPA: hypothetical protein VLJ57_21340 [Burkholderiaceae bacterium]|nr:hypothetical protein [Burkholderiaceae bacterium]
MRALISIGSVAAVLAALAGCALNPFAVTPGMSREQVVSKLGKPSNAIAVSAGERLQYSLQPSGRFAVMVDLDSAGRVIQARQVLTLAEFSRIELGKWTRGDIEREFGRPAMVDHVTAWKGDVMTYRWSDGSDMFFWVYLDGQGVVQRTQQGMEFYNAPDRM